MKDRETSRKRTLNGIRKHLALGVALPGMLAMSISVQAQSTKLPSSKKIAVWSEHGYIAHEIITTSRAWK